MQTSTLDARTRLSIEMAVTGQQGDPALIRWQDREAMRLGLCGAEIDAARAGRSFDRRIAQAIKLALAAAPSDAEKERSRAIEVGFDEAACREIKRIANADALDVRMIGHV